MNKIYKFAWLVSLLVPFLLLNWKWAIVVLFINFIGILPLGIITVGILKPIFGAGHWLLFVAGGVSEALLYILLNLYLNHPNNFMIALVSVYLVNQLGRIFRAGIQKDELITMVGFLGAVLVYYSFGLLF